MLPNKTQATYDRLFGELATHLNGHVPTDILFDYEKAAMNSAENVFAGITVTCCFFHLSQNIWRRIQENGLQPLYRNDPDFAKFMRMTVALAFVPAVDVPQAFDDIEYQIRNNYNQNGIDIVLDYFEDNYIRRQRRGRPGAAPLFPLQVWNMYGRARDELPKTSNHVEGWHRRSNASRDGVHPNLWKFVRSLQREESLIRAEVQQAIGGHPHPRKAKIRPMCRKGKEHHKRLPEQTGKYIEISTCNFP